MTDNELLLAMSEMMDKKLNALDETFDKKLEPVKEDIRAVKEDIRAIKAEIENSINPKIDLLAENYVPAARRFELEASNIEAMREDIKLLKEVVTEHSKKLQKIS